VSLGHLARNITQTDFAPRIAQHLNASCFRWPSSYDFYVVEILIYCSLDKDSLMYLPTCLKERLMELSPGARLSVFSNSVFVLTQFASTLLIFRSVLRHTVGLPGRVISSSRNLCIQRATQRKPRTNSHAVSGIRTRRPMYYCSWLP
jgi:hypothetical protein